MMTHKHHIIPKHAGGSDDPSNLIDLSIADHAEAHRELWEQNNCWQDYLAWQALSGLISGEEARRLAVSYALKGKPKTVEHRKKMSIARKQHAAIYGGPSLGKKFGKYSIDRVKKARDALLANPGEGMKGKTHSATTKVKMSDAAKLRPLLTCHCGKTMTAQNFNRYHGAKCALPDPAST